MSGGAVARRVLRGVALLVVRPERVGPTRGRAAGAQGQLRVEEARAVLVELERLSALQGIHELGADGLGFVLRPGAVREAVALGAREDPQKPEARYVTEVTIGLVTQKDLPGRGRASGRPLPGRRRPERCARVIGFNVIRLTAEEWRRGQ